MNSANRANQKLNKSFCHIVANSNEIDLNPIKLDYFGEMNESVLSLRIHQKYKNNNRMTNSPDCKAYLTLPQTLTQSITGVECVLNGTEIKLKVEENERVKEIVKLGEMSGRMTISSEISDDDQLIKIFLGLLPYNSECDVTIQMEIISTNSDSNIIQTVIPFSDQTINSKDFTFSIDFNESIKIEKIDIIENSESKNKNFTFNGKNLKLTQKPIGSIVLLTELNGEIPNIVINDINDPYSIIQIYPKFSNKSINSDFIFIVDCSGSMAGSSIRNAAECLSVFMHSLPVGCNFNIIRFGSSFECVFNNDRLVQYNATNLKRADQAISNLKADMGGTNLYGPLFSAYQQSQNSRKKGKIVQIFLITDGMISDKETVFKLTRKNRSKNRLFALGIGNEVDKDLVSGLATLSYGKFDFINSSALITDKVINLLSLSLSPALTDIEIHSSNDSSLEIVPNPLTPIYDGSMMTIYIKRSDEDKPIENVLFTGNIGDEQTEFVIDKFINISKSSAKKLFAYNAIIDYQNIIEDSSMNQTEIKKIKDKIIELSIDNKIPSKFTSFVGVEKDPHLSPDQIEKERNKSMSSNRYMQQQHQHRHYCRSTGLFDMDDEHLTKSSHKMKKCKKSNKRSLFDNDDDFLSFSGSNNNNTYQIPPSQLQTKSNSIFEADIINRPKKCQCLYSAAPSPFKNQYECCYNASPSPYYNQRSNHSHSYAMKQQNCSYSNQSLFESPNYQQCNQQYSQQYNQQCDYESDLKESLFDCDDNENDELNEDNFSEDFVSSAPPKVDYSLMGVISLQEFDGKWSSSLLQPLIDFLYSDKTNHNEEVLNEIFRLIQNLDDETIGCIKSTLVALFILNKFYMKELTKWKLIQSKAIHWLHSKANLEWEVEIPNLITKI